MGLDQIQKHLHPRIIEALGSENCLSESSLTNQQFEILRLYCVEQMTQKNISQKLGVSIAVVRQEITKGLYILRKALNPAEFEQARKILYARKNQA